MVKMWVEGIGEQICATSTLAFGRNLKFTGVFDTMQWSREIGSIYTPEI